MATELKHTVTPAGQGGDYNTIQAAIAHLAASHSNLVTADVYATIEISGTWSSPDSTALDIDGLTVDATRYLSIVAVGAARHAGVWSSSYYQHVVNAAAINGYIREAYVRFDGIQFGATGANQAHTFFKSIGLSATSDFRLSNVIFKGHGNASYVERLFEITTGTFPTTYVWNMVGFNFGANAGSYIIASADMPLTFYSSTFISASIFGFRKDGGTLVLKNCYAGGTSNSDYYGSPTMTTCASSDSTGTVGLRTIAVNTTQFVNVTGGSENFHLPLGSALINVGTDTSGDAAPLNFTTDIDGDTRSTWDIGADEYVAAGGATNIVYMLFES